MRPSIFNNAIERMISPEQFCIEIKSIFLSYSYNRLTFPKSLCSKFAQKCIFKVENFFFQNWYTFCYLEKPKTLANVIFYIGKLAKHQLIIKENNNFLYFNHLIFLLKINFYASENPLLDIYSVIFGCNSLFLRGFINENLLQSVMNEMVLLINITRNNFFTDIFLSFDKFNLLLLNLMYLTERFIPLDESGKLLYTILYVINTFVQISNIKEIDPKQLFFLMSLVKQILTYNKDFFEDDLSGVVNSISFLLTQFFDSCQEQRIKPQLAIDLLTILKNLALNEFLPLPYPKIINFANSFLTYTDITETQLCVIHEIILFFDEYNSNGEIEITDEIIALGKQVKLDLENWFDESCVQEILEGQNSTLKSPTSSEDKNTPSFHNARFFSKLYSQRELENLENVNDSQLVFS